MSPIKIPKRPLKPFKFGTVCNGQWGQSNSVDPMEWPKIGLLNQEFGSILLILPRKQAKHRVHLVTKLCSVRTLEILGACAMTTNYSTIKFVLPKFYCRGVSHEKTALWTIFSLCPQFLGSMFHLELGVDFDRGFSSGFSLPDYFRPYSVCGQAHRVPKSVPKSVFSLRETLDKKSATVAKSVRLGRDIHRNIRHNHQKNQPQFHSAQTCALQFRPPIKAAILFLLSSRRL